MQDRDIFTVCGNINYGPQVQRNILSQYHEFVVKIWTQDHVLTLICASLTAPCHDIAWADSTAT